MKIEINASEMMRVKKHMECVWDFIWNNRPDGQTYHPKGYVVMVERSPDGVVSRERAS